MNRWNRIEEALKRRRNKEGNEKQNSFSNMVEIDKSITGKIVKIKLIADEAIRPMCREVIEATIYGIGATSMSNGDEITIICPSNEIADELRKAWSK